MQVKEKELLEVEVEKVEIIGNSIEITFSQFIEGEGKVTCRHVQNITSEYGTYQEEHKYSNAQFNS